MSARRASIALVVRGPDLAAALREGLAASGLAPIRTVEIGADATAAPAVATAARGPGVRAVVVADPALDPDDALRGALDDARARRRPVLVFRPRAGEDWSADVEDAALHRHGALPVRSADDLVEIARALRTLGDCPPARIAVAAASLALDAAVRALAADAGVAYGDAPGSRVFAVPADLPLVGARARLAALRTAADHLRRMAGVAAARPAPPRGARAKALDLLARSEPTLTEREARLLLALYGVASPPEEVVSSPSAAGAAGRRIGFPVSLRVVTPDVRDVADVGGVATGVQNGAQARGAYVRVLVAAHERAPKARLEGVLVAKAPPPGVRLRVATRRHARLGAAVALGLAGPPVPGGAANAVRVAPLAPKEAEALVAEAPAARLLLARPAATRRGERPPDLRALAAAVQRMSLLAWDLGDAVDETEATLVVRPRAEGCVVVEASATRVP